MIYLYFDRNANTLHLFTTGRNLSSDYKGDAYWTEIETVTADADRGQILAHGRMGIGIVAEFPIHKTVLTCQKPLEP